jgi:hypothetical protein
MRRRPWLEGLGFQMKVGQDLQAHQVLPLGKTGATGQPHDIGGAGLAASMETTAIFKMWLMGK